MSQESEKRVFTTFPEIPAALNENVGIGDDQLPPSLNDLDSECFPWINRRSKINRLEVQAALNMSVNVLPFWLCTFPVSCYAMGLYWCIRLEGDCTFILITWPYMWDFFLLHSIYNPMMYMLSSSEFQRALTHITRRFTIKFHIQAQDNWFTVKTQSENNIIFKYSYVHRHCRLEIIILRLSDLKY